MRRAITVLGLALAGIGVSAPAYAFAHNRVTNPFLHAVLDVLSLAIVLAPIWTAFLWKTPAQGRRARSNLMLLGLIAVVQLPSAVVAFAPIANPVLHAFLLTASLSVTIAAVVYVRRQARVPEPTTASEVAR